MPHFIPTTAEITRIAALSDPVIRNLEITYCYHQLALVMKERIGPETNWCTFATWASRQAGQTIRKQDLERTLESIVGTGILAKEVESFVAAVRRFGVRLQQQKLARLMWKAVDLEGSFTRSSAAVARGNLKVFTEIGHEFARFYATCLKDTRYDHENLTRFLNELLPGPPPDGQDYLRLAFDSYYKAFFEQNTKARSELMFMANLQIGFHEQTRLQPEILEALDAPVPTPRDFTASLLNAYFPQAPGLAKFLHAILRIGGRMTGFDDFVARYLASARRQAQNIVTNTMMTIDLPPNIRLRLGEDLPPGFPPALQHILNPDLAALLTKIDPTPDSVRDSGAEYWGDLSDRIHFIADMFRRYHSTAHLFDPPFSPNQVKAMKEGQLPSGKL